VFCTVANPALRWHLIHECHTGHARMAESSQSRAPSREGSSSETRRPKPANSYPQELGYKPALAGSARRGFGSLFLCQSSVVKIIALVLKQKTLLRVWIVSASVATRSLHWPKRASVGYKPVEWIDGWAIPDSQDTNQHVSCTASSRPVKKNPRTFGNCNSRLEWSD